MFVCGIDRWRWRWWSPARPRGEILGLACDVSVEADVARLTDAAARALGGVDVLVNNAGIARSDPFLAIEAADWDRILR